LYTTFDFRVDQYRTVFLCRKQDSCSGSAMINTRTRNND
jgi:hypothetical protein